MIITTNITMDLSRQGPMQVISAVQDDRYSRNIAMALTCGGVAWEPPESTTVQVRYRKPDGTGGNYDALPDGTPAWTIAGNILTIALAPQVCTVPGRVTLTAALVQGETQLHTYPIIIDVQPNPWAGVNDGGASDDTGGSGNGGETQESVAYLYGKPSEGGNIGLRSGDAVTYYEGAVLPAVRMSDGYPHAYILNTLFPPYNLFMTDTPLNVTCSESTGNPLGVNTNGETIDYVQGGVINNGQEWGSSFETGIISHSYKPIWSNTDMRKSYFIGDSQYELTDEIGFAATEPIPVGEIVDYNGDIPIYEVII